jgi:hypothetical protein
MTYKPLRRVSKFSTIRPDKTAAAELVVVVRGEKEAAYPPEMEDLVRRYGEGYAWVIVKLREQGVPADSDLELLPYHWLTMNNVPFAFQVEVPQASAKIDFLLTHMPEGAMVWRVQGSYWHPEGAKGSSDDVQKAALIGAEALGFTIKRVIDLQEADIIDKLPMLCEDAMRGVEWSHF